MSGPSSQSMPAQRRDATMAASDAAVERARSVSSMRSTNRPPWRRAKARLKSATYAVPT